MAGYADPARDGVKVDLAKYGLADTAADLHGGVDNARTGTTAGSAGTCNMHGRAAACTWGSGELLRVQDLFLKKLGNR